MRKMLQELFKNTAQFLSDLFKLIIFSYAFIASCDSTGIILKKNKLFFVF